MLDFLKAIFVIVLLYFGYELALKHAGFIEKSPEGVYAPPPAMYAPVEERFEAPPAAELAPSPKPLPTVRQIAPAGPSPPAQQMEPGVRHIMAPEQPLDPYAEMQEDAYAPEKIRNPERMFRPAPENDNTTIATMSGIANTLNAVPQHVGSFAPEMAQNGGYFMSGVAANDLDVPNNYSEY
jgi:hypothetical protein